jgi:hypothetical protein
MEKLKKIQRKSLKFYAKPHLGYIRHNGESMQTKQMIFMRFVDNILAFADWKNMMYWQKYMQYCKSKFLD